MINKRNYKTIPDTVQFFSPIFTIWGLRHLIERNPEVGATAIKIGGRILVDVDELGEWVEKHRLLKKEGKKVEEPEKSLSVKYDGCEASL